MKRVDTIEALNIRVTADSEEQRATIQNLNAPDVSVSFGVNKIPVLIEV